MEGVCALGCQCRSEEVSKKKDDCEDCEDQDISHFKPLLDIQAYNSYRHGSTFRENAAIVKHNFN